MKTLALFRHAKSDWSDARARDFDRPLNERGKRGARAMGEYIRDTGRTFDRMIASPAVRAAETVEESSKAWKCTFKIEWDRRIYLASSATLIDLLKELSGDPKSVLMIGHNPGLESLGRLMAGPGSSDKATDNLLRGFPPAGLAVFELNGENWRTMSAEGGRLTEFVRPGTAS
ncbi:MAG: histidine phosphatase family protein [Novosphingobium sp.]